jgi:hypothetical protein
MNQIQQPPADPMRGQFVVTAAKGKVPVGQYVAEYVSTEYLPPMPDDPMSGKKGRQWPCFRFRWKVIDGEWEGQVVERDAPVPEKLTPNTAYAQWVGYLLGRQVGAEQFD